jgi:hypothetical protein
MTAESADGFFFLSAPPRLDYIHLFLHKLDLAGVPMPNTTTVLLLAVAAVVLVGGGLAYWFLRRGWQRGTAAAYFHFRCPGCQRRLRYHRRQVGHKGGCSNCGKEVTFPPISQSVE